MRRLFMEPIGIFILAMVCQLYSCAQNVSDSVEQMSYASVAGEEYLEGDKIETNLNNKVLGERRALEVRDFLIVKGISGKKIRVVSFGEEKPLKRASTEQAWSENRRVEISLY